MPAGRPAHEFNWNLLDSLLALEASEQFVAESMLKEEKKPITPRRIAAKIKLIQRRIKEVWDLNFVQYRVQKIEYQKMTLRQRQWKAVNEGVPSLLIWMGKQYLGQADKNEERITQDRPSEVKIIWSTRNPSAGNRYDEKHKPEADDLEPEQQSNAVLTPLED